MHNMSIIAIQFNPKSGGNPKKKLVFIIMTFIVIGRNNSVTSAHTYALRIITTFQIIIRILPFKLVLITVRSYYSLLSRLGHPLLV